MRRSHIVLPLAHSTSRAARLTRLQRSCIFAQSTERVQNTRSGSSLVRANTRPGGTERRSIGRVSTQQPRALSSAIRWPCVNTQQPRAPCSAIRWPSPCFKRPGWQAFVPHPNGCCDRLHRSFHRKRRTTHPWLLLAARVAFRVPHPLGNDYLLHRSFGCGRRTTLRPARACCEAAYRALSRADPRLFQRVNTRGRSAHPQQGCP